MIKWQNTCSYRLCFHTINPVRPSTLEAYEDDCGIRGDDMDEGSEE